MYLFRKAFYFLNKNREVFFWVVALTLLYFMNPAASTNSLCIFKWVGFSGCPGCDFIIGQIGMGVLYFLTGGLCLVSTIVYIVIHKSLAFEFNQKMAIESMRMIRR